MGVLLLVRHGQASFGADDYDVLSDVGVRQAGLVGTRLAPLDLRRVIAGRLRRQQDTARHLLTAAGLALEVETDGGWDEYDPVDVLTGVPPRDVSENRAFQGALDEGLARWTSGEHDGEYRETWPAFSARVRDALERSVGGPGTTVVVASAGSIGVATAALLGLPSPGWARIARTQINTGITKVVVGRSGCSLVSVNDHAHLEVEPGLATYR